MRSQVEQLNGLNGSLKSYNVPSLNDLLHATSKPYPYHDQFEDVVWKPVLVLHSSGSTGKR